MHTSTFKTCLLLIFLCIQSQLLRAQNRWDAIDEDIKGATAVDTIKQGKYSLIFINKSPDFDTAVKKRLVEVFFINYPKEAKLYNKKTTRKVVFIVDPAYEGVAAAASGIVRFNPAWFKKNPGDVDVVTHEVMHLVQSYPNGAGPGWITEGIADYVRFTLGVDNEGANWKLPEFSEKQSYENAYRITARFFYWVERNVKKGTIKKLDKAMRENVYAETFWEKTTGKSLQSLWEEYSRKPTISG